MQDTFMQVIARANEIVSRADEAIAQAHTITNISMGCVVAAFVLFLFGSLRLLACLSQARAEAAYLLGRLQELEQPVVSTHSWVIEDRRTI